MTQPAVEVFANRWVALAASGTPSSASDSFQLFDGKIGTGIALIERPRDNPVMTADDRVAGKETAYVEGDFSIQPPTTPGSSSGTTGRTPCERALLPAALTRALSSTNSTTRYTPISTGIPTVNLRFWQGGLYWDITSGNANINALRMAEGEQFTAQGWRLEGPFSSTTDVDEDDVPTDGDVSAQVEPSVISPSNSVARIFQGDSSTALPLFVHCRSLVIGLGNEAKVTEFTQLTKSGVVKRKGTFEMTIARTDLADFNPWTARKAGTIIRGDFAVVDDDSTRYSRLFFRGKIDAIEVVDEDGWFGVKLSGRCLATPGSAGDDYGIEFGLDSLRLIGDLPDQAAGAYSQRLSLQGIYGSAVTYTVHSGSLPGGCSLDSATGVVSGTATAGTTTCVIRATTTDLAGNTITADSASQAITIT